MLKLDLNEGLNNKRPGYDYARMTDYEHAKKVLGGYAGVEPDHLVITNGSFHALDLVLGFLFKAGDKILLPVPTFPCYEKFERQGDLKFIKLKYGPSFSAQTILEKLRSTLVQGLYLANPNNPIGYTFTKSEIEKIVTEANKRKVLVLLDEAYFEFCGITAVNLVGKHDNLVITRTLSKAFGLAGVRFGYIITNPKLARKLEEFKGPPYIISHLALNIGAKALSAIGQKKMKKYVSENNKTRKDLANFLTEQGCEVFPSQTNFVSFKTKNSARITAGLAKKNILVKDLNDYLDGQPSLKNCIRITIPSANKLAQIKMAILVFTKTAIGYNGARTRNLLLHRQAL